MKKTAGGIRYTVKKKMSRKLFTFTVNRIPPAVFLVPPTLKRNFKLLGQNFELIPGVHEENVNKTWRLVQILFFSFSSFFSFF